LRVQQEQQRVTLAPGEAEGAFAGNRSATGPLSTASGTASETRGSARLVGRKSLRLLGLLFHDVLDRDSEGNNA
jgi:hypothetical protein